MRDKDSRSYVMQAVFGLLTVHVLGYLVFRYSHGQWVDYLMFSAGTSEREMDAAMKDFRPYTWIRYDYGVTSGLLYVVFYPAAWVDGAMTGAQSRFDGWTAPVYLTPIMTDPSAQAGESAASQD